MLSTVYASHVDLPGLGGAATPASERNFPNEQWFAKEVMPSFSVRDA